MQKLNQRGEEGYVIFIFQTGGYVNLPRDNGGVEYLFFTHLNNLPPPSLIINGPILIYAP